MIYFWTRLVYYGSPLVDEIDLLSLLLDLSEYFFD